MAKKVSSDGYYIAKFNVNKVSKSVAVHRLVVETFIPNPDNLPEINHIDTNRQNNHVDNLEWITHENNIAHSVELGHYKHYRIDNSNYRNTALHDYYSVNPDKTKEILVRPGHQNGHARKIALYNKDRELINILD